MEQQDRPAEAWRQACSAGARLAQPGRLGYDGPGIMMTRFLTAAALTATLVLLPAWLGAAEEPFHITFERGPDEPTSLVLVGTVSNESSRDVVDLWVTADALNARGRGVGRGVAFVAPLLRGRASTAFTVKLPRVPNVHRFRMFVSSFRYLSSTESP